MRRRVVITGLGCVTPLGSEPQRVWDRLAAGQSAVGPITLFDATHLPVQIAAEVSDWDMSDVGEAPDEWDRHSRQTRFAVAASLKAARTGCLTSSRLDPLRFGVYLGCGEVYPDFSPFADVAGESFDEDGFHEGRFFRGLSNVLQRSDALAWEPDAPLGCISGLLDAQGPCVNYTTACVSGSVAIGEAMEVIRRGDADVMLAGAAHSMIHPFGITGFHRLSTLSTRNQDAGRAYRPFDRDRDGFVVGEGAAVVVLEELQHARQRRAEIWAELLGYGASHDAFRITDPRPDGSAAARCMTQALADAEIEPCQIDYVNAHGSGTVVNDRVETMALKRALGSQARRIPVSSTKSMTGHLTTACGALELMIGVLAIRHQVLPPTINYDTPDPDCDLDYVPNQARESRCQNVLSNNLGFGGQNVSLVVSGYGG